MMRNFLLFLLPFTILHSQVFYDENEVPKDQFRAIFEANVYVLYKALDFANDHGFRYVQILSYEFTGFEHALTGNCTHAIPDQGRFFKLQDEFLTISFLCFEEAPNNRNIIDLEEYRSLIEEVTEGIDPFFK